MLLFLLILIPNLFSNSLGHLVHWLVRVQPVVHSDERHVESGTYEEDDGLDDQALDAASVEQAGDQGWHRPWNVVDDWRDEANLGKEDTDVEGYWLAKQPWNEVDRVHDDWQTESDWFRNVEDSWHQGDVGDLLSRNSLGEELDGQNWRY